MGAQNLFLAQGANLGTPLIAFLSHDYVF